MKNPTKVASTSEYRDGGLEETWPLVPRVLSPLAGQTEPTADVLALTSFQLLARARSLAARNASDRQISVILAMSACDLHFEQCLVRLMVHRTLSLDAKLSLQDYQFSLAAPRAQNLYKFLTRDAPWGDPALALAPASWWGDWNATRDLRQRVAQAGAAVSVADAARCIRCCVSFMAHLTDQMAQASARGP